MKTNELWRFGNRASAMIGFGVPAACLAAILAVATTVFAQHRMHGQQVKEDRNHPWMNANLSPDERANMVLKEMTLDEKIDLLHGMACQAGLGRSRIQSQNWETAGRGLCLACRG